MVKPAFTAASRATVIGLAFRLRDPEQLAGQLGNSSGALRVRKHRALQRLSAALGEEVTQ